MKRKLDKHEKRVYNKVVRELREAGNVISKALTNPRNVRAAKRRIIRTNRALRGWNEGIGDVLGI